MNAHRRHDELLTSGDALTDDVPNVADIPPGWLARLDDNDEQVIDAWGGVQRIGRIWRARTSVVFDHGRLRLPSMAATDALHRALRELRAAARAGRLA